MKEYKKINYYASIKEFKGNVLKSYEINECKDEIIFNFDNGKSYLMYHNQDCCECVSIEDIVGNLDNLIGEPLEMAEEISNVSARPLCDYDESYTWTYYKFATINGYVTIRWYGSSNGYYSESVDIAEIKYI